MAPLWKTTCSLFVSCSPLILIKNDVHSQPVNMAEVDSPWPGFHAGPARQASTRFPGPDTSSPLFATVHYFANDTPDQVDLGTSPWHILSDHRYENDSQARSIWGVSLQYLYKYRITESDGLQYVDSYRLVPDFLPAVPYITWNFVALADGRIVVPLPNGLRRLRDNPCYGTQPALVVFRDDDSSVDSPISCLHRFEFTRRRLNAACGFWTYTEFSSFTFQAVLFSGHLVVKVIHRPLFSRREEMWLLVLDNDITTIQACARVTEDGTSSNAFALEPTDVTGETRFYLATESELIQVLYQASSNTLTRETATIVEYRGRTGTTPTLLGFENEDQWILSVDGRCYVSNPFTGAIVCDGNTERSSLVAIPRPLTGRTNDIRRIELPSFVDAVENSPAVAGNDIVVCSYSGYTPDGPLDGEPNFALGIIKLSWNPSQREFQIDWTNGNVQCSGIPTIASSSNLVFFTGADRSDGQTYFRAARLNTDDKGPGGEIVASVPAGPSSGDNAVFDAGNSLIINDVGSAIFPAGNSLVHISSTEFQSDPPPDPPRRSICFAGNMMVTLRDGREIPIRDVQVGDEVLASPRGDYQVVYSLCKRNFHSTSKFLQIKAKDTTLELSENHLLLLHNQGSFYPISKAASEASLGDRLVMADGSTETIQGIQVVTRVGYFAPYTYSGTIMVNGVFVSTYATLPLESAVPTYLSMLSQQTMYHVGQAHHRLLCKLHFVSCLNERYNDEGFSSVVGWSFGVYHSLQSFQSPMVQSFVATGLSYVSVSLYFVDQVVSTSGLGLLITSIVVWRRSIVMLWK